MAARRHRRRAHMANRPLILIQATSPPRSPPGPILADPINRQPTIQAGRISRPHRALLIQMDRPDHPSARSQPRATGVLG